MFHKKNLIIFNKKKNELSLTYFITVLTIFIFNHYRK